MKKLLSLVAVIFLFNIIYVSSASASTAILNSQNDEISQSKADKSAHSHTDELSMQDGEINPLYIPCEGTGRKHQMTGRGKGQVPLTNGKNYFGNLYQCIGCSQGIVSVNNYYGILKPSAPGEYIAVYLPHQTQYGYDFTKKGVKYNLSYSDSYTSGLFESIEFVY